jgi:hypothetical protein
MMEKAQERKKLANLDGHKGMTKVVNPFSALSSDDISRVANSVGASLGSSSDEIEGSLLEIHNCDKSRSEVFEGQCDQCQEIVKNGSRVGSGSKALEGPEDVMQTPISRSCQS